MLINEVLISEPPDPGYASPPPPGCASPPAPGIPSGPAPPPRPPTPPAVLPATRGRCPRCPGPARGCWQVSAAGGGARDSPAHCGFGSAPRDGLGAGSQRGGGHIPWIWGRGVGVATTGHTHMDFWPRPSGPLEGWGHFNVMGVTEGSREVTGSEVNARSWEGHGEVMEVTPRSWGVTGGHWEWGHPEVMGRSWGSPRGHDGVTEGS